MNAKTSHTRRSWLRCFGAGAAGLFAGSHLLSAQPVKPNVLFITIDDLNDWVGCLGGHPQVKTPNIDRLAKRGVLFSNAHCQAPICNPSRASFMTGLLPSTSGVYQLAPDFRSAPELKNVVTIPRHFAAHGYQTYQVGKIYHSAYPDEVSFQKNGPRPGQGPRPEEKLNLPGAHPLWDWGPVFNNEEMGDQKVADWFLDEFPKMEPAKPFFFAVGFYRPHVPLFAPKEWFDMYPLEEVELPPMHADDRDDIPEAGKELTLGYPAPRHEWFVENKKWKHAVQAYLATVTFVDYQVGRVLDALEASPHAGNTIVVLLSDHGWHLGEKERWAKRSLWERSTRVPLIVSVPGGSVGTTTAKPVDLVDVYPTLIELCRLKQRPELDGQSLKTLLRNPEAVWDRPALTTFEKNNHALRSEHFRYIRYADGSEELYDHRRDPHEWTNLAGDEKHKSVINDHRRWLPLVNKDPIPGSVDSAAVRWRNNR